MATPYEHKAFFHDLTSDEISELKDIHAFMKQYFGNKEYFSSTRETLANRSVEHYHMHFIPGQLQGAYLRKMLENQGFPIQEELDITKRMD
jgi:diadenosine tetraphosphate (Ap4A) HIT family hydrolase